MFILIGVRYVPPHLQTPQPPSNTTTSLRILHNLLMCHHWLPNPIIKQQLSCPVIIGDHGNRRQRISNYILSLCYVAANFGVLEIVI